MPPDCWWSDGPRITHTNECMSLITRLRTLFCSQNPYSMEPVTGRAYRSVGSLSVSFRVESLLMMAAASATVALSGLDVGMVRFGFSGSKSTESAQCNSGYGRNGRKLYNTRHFPTQRLNLYLWACIVRKVIMVVVVATLSCKDRYGNRRKSCASRGIENITKHS